MLEDSIFQQTAKWLNVIETLPNYLVNGPFHFLSHIHQTFIIGSLQGAEFTSRLLISPFSYFITVIFVYVFIYFTIYEVALSIGIYFDLCKPAGYEVFVDYPTHCAHIYVSLNVTQALTDSETAKTCHKNMVETKTILSTPIKYHFEFSPDEYSDPDLGTDLKFLRGKVLHWFRESTFWYKHKNEYQDVDLKYVCLFNKKGELLEKEDDFLCNLEITTGDTVNCLIKVFKNDNKATYGI